MATMRRVYCRYCEQTYQTQDMERCSLCRKTGGLVDPMSPDAVPMKIEEANQPWNVPDVGTAVRSVLLARRLVIWTVGGFVLIGLGIWLALQPELRSDPQRFAINDLAVGSGPILAGLFLLIVSYFTLRRLRTVRNPVQNMEKNQVPQSKKVEGL